MLKVGGSAPITPMCEPVHNKPCAVPTQNIEFNSRSRKTFSTKVSMSRENANIEGAEAVWGENRPKAVPATAREKLSTRSTWTNLGLVLQRTLDGYRPECAELMDLKRFDATAADGKNLVVYNRNRSKHDTASGAPKWQWAVLGQKYVGIFVSSLFVAMLFVRCKQESTYCRRLREAIDASM